MEIVLSSSNKDKIFEIENILGQDYKILLKSDVGLGDLEVIEDGETLKENSYIKARAIYDRLKRPVMADDTGLFVDYLNGDPGVNTARFAGDHATYEDNNAKLLDQLRDVESLEDRSARFMTSICFIDQDGKDHYVEGVLEGYIAFERRGRENYFGYNPIFIVKGLDKTLAELKDDERLKVNHRRKALDKLKELLGDLK